MRGSRFEGEFRASGGRFWSERVVAAKRSDCSRNTRAGAGKTLESRATGAGVETAARLAARLAAQYRADPGHARDPPRAHGSSPPPVLARGGDIRALDRGRVSENPAFVHAHRRRASARAATRSRGAVASRRARGVHGTDIEHTPLQPRLERRHQSPLRPSPARVRAIARTHRSHAGDAGTAASRALATRDVTPGIPRAVGTCAHLSWTWFLLCCVDSALLCAVEKGNIAAGASLKSPSPEEAALVSAFLLSRAFARLCEL